MTQDRQPSLEGKVVMVVEDEYLVAKRLVDLLAQEGVVTAGPFGRLDAALAFVEGGGRADLAITDLNLAGQMAYPLVDALLRCSVPVITVTGYDGSSVEPAYRDLPRCQKPFTRPMLLNALRSALG